MKTSKMMNPIVVKCFCDEDDKSGNPAAIYIDQLISDEEKQQTASKLNLPVTVFVTSVKGGIPLIEFFYPNRKMPLCLHGTLAAAHILFSESDQKSMIIRTSNGKNLQLNQNATNHFEVEVAFEKVDQPMLSSLTASQLLNIDTAIISKALPFTVASVGSPKLLIPISSRNKLDNLTPNYLEIKNWSLINKVNGIYAYCHDEVADIFYARNFNPMTGHNEDAATGVAAAALSLQLARSIVVKQGQTVGLPCKIHVRFENKNSIWVGGAILRG